MSETVEQHPYQRRRDQVYRTGVVTIILGVFLLFGAESFSTVILSSDSNGSVSTVDEDRREMIQTLASQVITFGLAMFVVYSAALFRSED